MKQENEREALFRKFIANRCSPEEIEQVFQYLTSREADTALHRLIAQQLQLSALSSEKIDPELTGEMRSRILSELQRQHRRTAFSEISDASSDAARESPDFVKLHQEPSSFPRTDSRRIWKIAAVFAGILMLAGATYYRLFMYAPWVVRETGYGEVVTLVLPDSSEVVLNSNSSIRYAKAWSDRLSREVWIDGEVFFSVRHTADDQKFIVHPSSNFDVEVLGTEFTVYNRQDASRVVLNTGKVQLNIHNQTVTSQVDMKPGELVELEEASGTYRKHKVNPELYSSWVNGSIVLDNTSFREISNLLQETYGLSVKVPDSALYGERFTGTVPSDNIKSLLKALALAFDLEIKTEDEKVIFKTRNLNKDQ